MKLSAVMAASTFVGCVTGLLSWLHLGVLCIWSLMAGLLVAVGNRGAVVGTQAIIALVAFGRFSQPALSALGLAGLVFAGGLTQVLFLSIVRWPLPLRVQRKETAAAYRVLAALATASAEISMVPAAVALDQAGAAISSPNLFGDPSLMTLRSLVDEGHRVRVQLSAIHALLRQLRKLPDDLGRRLSEQAERFLKLTTSELHLAADAIEGDTAAAAALRERFADLSSQAAGSDLIPRLGSEVS